VQYRYRYCAVLAFILYIIVSIIQVPVLHSISALYYTTAKAHAGQFRFLFLETETATGASPGPAIAIAETGVAGSVLVDVDILKASRSWKAYMH
jgi:hypothetical protein